MLNNNNDNGAPQGEPILSLEEDPTEHEVTKDISIAFDLKVQPDEARSAEFKQTVRVLRGNEPTRVTLGWGKDVERVLIKSNKCSVQTGPTLGSEAVTDTDGESGNDLATRESSGDGH